MRTEAFFNRRTEKVMERSLDGGLHCSSYHKFFEGYTEYTVPRNKGKGKKIVRIYTADYYQQDLSTQQAVFLRILYLIMLLTTLFLFITCAEPQVEINTKFYVVLVQAGTIAGLFWTCITFFSYLLLRRKMTIYEFRTSSIALKRASLFSGIFLELNVLFGICFIIFENNTDGMKTWITLSGYAVGGLILMGIHMIEARIEYVKIPNETQEIWNGVEID